MVRVKSADFRASMSSYLDRVQNGEKIMITRKNQMFMLTPVMESELVLTPELEARLSKARQEISKGECVSFDNKDEMNAWLDSL